MTRCEIPIFNLIFNFYSNGITQYLGSTTIKIPLHQISSMLYWIETQHLWLKAPQSIYTKELFDYVLSLITPVIFQTFFKSHRKLIIKRNKAKLKKQKQKNESKNIICSIFSFFTLSGLIFLRWRLQVRMCPCLS